MAERSEQHKRGLPWRKRIALVIVPRAAAIAIAAIGVTLRFRVIAEPGAQPAPNPARGIYCFWHQCTYSAAWYFRKYNACILISRSFDGELIARTLGLLGFRSVRGSSSRAAVAGLVALRQEVASGGLGIFTADGPRGPRYVSKMGPIKLAQQTRIPIGCFHLHPERAWVFRSWDAFSIPRPFTRVFVSWGRSIPAPPQGATDEQMEAARTAVDASLERARTLAISAAAGAR